jgi:hypothetical protein
MVVCQFMTAQADHPELAVGADHLANPEHHYVWPLPDGNALWVTVCQEHFDWLQAHDVAAAGEDL